MALNSEQQVRFSVYGFLGFIILVAGYFYFQILQQTAPADEMGSLHDSRTEYVASDPSVLDTKKFKDLRAVVVPATVTATIPVSDLTDEQLAKLPRNPNPFSPSF